MDSTGLRESKIIIFIIRDKVESEMNKLKNQLDATYFII